MSIDSGVINIENPFTQESWIKQNLGFTLHRQEQAKGLFGSSTEKIMNAKPANENRYVAFVAIRWGFAIIKNDILTPTEKWHNRHLCNSKGVFSNK